MPRLLSFLPLLLSSSAGFHTPSPAAAVRPSNSRQLAIQVSPFVLRREPPGRCPVLRMMALRRREVIGLGAAALTACTSAALAEQDLPEEDLPTYAPYGVLEWEPRSSIPRLTEKTSYQPRFITYLARFLLNFDRGSAAWWAEQSRQLPVGLNREALRAVRERQFGQFSESVEVGLVRYQGQQGVRLLFSLMRSRYGKTPLAKVQLALLFSLISAANQPSDLIENALGEAENGHVNQVFLTSGGRGYTSAEPPKVTLTPPDGGLGKMKTPAQIRAVLEVSGNVRGVTLTNSGGGYSSAPAVSFSPPRDGGRPAEAIAIVEGGRVVAVEMMYAGDGYTERDANSVVVTIEPPRDEQGVPLADGISAQGVVRLERSVAQLVLDSPGAGYSAGQPLVLRIEPPQACGGEPDGAAATGNVVLGGLADFSMVVGMGPYATTYRPGSVSGSLLQLLPATTRPERVFDFATGRSVFSLPLSAAEELQAAADEAAVAAEIVDDNDAAVSAAAAGDASSAAKFRAAATATSTAPARPRSRLDPSFGPLGTSPVEREVMLSARQYLAFAASGAACTSLVRTTLVPLDVAKTLMQSDQQRYPSLPAALQTLYSESGLRGLYASFDVTALSGLLLGGCGFGVNEFLRRYISALVGPQAQTLYPLQVSIAAALGSVIVACLATCPFEVLRIRAIKAATTPPPPPPPPPPLTLLEELQRRVALVAVKRDAPTIFFEGLGNLARRRSDAPPTFARRAVPSDARNDASRSSATGTSLATAGTSYAARDGARDAAVRFSSLSSLFAPAPLGTAPRREALDEVEPNGEGGSGRGDDDSDGQRAAAGANQAVVALTPDAYSAWRGLGTLWDEGGIALLYSALPTLLLREMPFSITKYVVFDATTQALAAMMPASQETPLASALLSLTGGLVAGVSAAAISTPADTLLTQTQAGRKSSSSGGGGDVAGASDARGTPDQLSLGEALSTQLATDPLGLFRGLLPRCVFFGALIAGQFLLYDQCKQLFKVAPDDLVFVLDVFADRLSFYEE